MVGEPQVIGVDTGGTFTDIFSSAGRVYKLPSTPRDPSHAIVEGLHSVGIAPGDAVAHGSTVATNAVLERRGARTVLLTTAGFEDVLEIRRQNRPALYDLYARWPEPLVPPERRWGVPERLTHSGEVLKPLDEEALRALTRRVREEGAEAVAVCLLYSYVDAAHEQAVETSLRAAGLPLDISLSHRIAPQYGEFERTSTTVVNAYVMPVMRRYLQSLHRELEGLAAGSLHVMHSNGGLISAHTAAERPVTTILSGPAAGVVGARQLAKAAGVDEIITFDMGGTSTDVAVVPGKLLEAAQGEISSFPLLLPMLTIETVGAGGGSIAGIDAGGALHVGPESAGADPGPAAYGKGDLPTVTDANLVLGRLSPRGLLDGAMPLDLARARAALHSIAEPLGLSLEQAAWAIVRLANSNMERAVRSVTLQRGYDPRRFILFAFGGAGPLHAAELASGLGIRRVLVPPYPGVMAALGLTVPDLLRDFRRTVLLKASAANTQALQAAFAELEGEARAAMESEHPRGFGDLHMEREVDMRYMGQSFELRLGYLGEPDALRDAFHRAHTERYGYAHPDDPVEIVHVHVRATLPRLQPPRVVPDWPEPSRPAEERAVWFGAESGVSGVKEDIARVLWRPGLEVGTRIDGPALVEQYDSMTVVPPGWTAEVDEGRNLNLRDVRS